MQKITNTHWHDPQQPGLTPGMVIRRNFGL